ncbi:MAG: hypothetical protein K2N64_08005 [Anaeroplasmataceae bacterium]|nr:hypothetical protein [Anaeroplasmataceae bacterium]
MKKNRVVIAIWLSIIAVLILAMIIYVIYAVKNNPYFGNTAPSYLWMTELIM